MHDFNEKLQEIIIDEEFSRLFPQLTDNEYCSLEDDILIHGCMNPLVLWNGILIDGHNRYNIVSEHNLPYKTISLEFNSREEVISWMITIQIYRRNLTPMQLTYYRGMQYNIEKKIHGGDRRSENISRGQNDPLEGKTANRLSEQYKVSPRTIKRDAQIADVIIAIGKESEDAKRSILTGETKINRKQLREMTSASEEDIAKTAEEIADGTFKEREKPASPDMPLEKTKDNSHPLTAAIIDEANKFVDNIRILTPGKNPDALKSSIRQIIDNLEKYYKQV